MRKINFEKYENILKRIAQGEKQSEIIESENCSYGTISKALKWDQNGRPRDEEVLSNTTNLLITIPKYWVDWLNTKIQKESWKDYGDAIVHILKYYDRWTREDLSIEEFEAKTREMKSKKMQGVMGSVMKEIKEDISQFEEIMKDLGIKSINEMSDLDKENQQKLMEAFIKKGLQRIEPKPSLQKEEAQKQTLDQFNAEHHDPLISEEQEVITELEIILSKKLTHVFPKMDGYEHPKVLGYIGPDEVYPFQIFPISYMTYKGHVVLLSLRGVGLTKIPKCVSNLPYLTFLNLGDNQIQEIPPEFEKLKNLSHLYLENNKIQAIPKYFENLNTLTFIHCPGNKIIDFHNFFLDAEIKQSTNIQPDEGFWKDKYIQHKKFRYKLLFLKDNPIKPNPDWDANIIEKLKAMIITGNLMIDNSAIPPELHKINSLI